VNQSDHFIDVLSQHNVDYRDCTIPIDISRTVSQDSSGQQFVNVFHQSLQNSHSPYFYFLLDVDYGRTPAYQALVFDVRDIADAGYYKLSEHRWNAIADKLTVIEVILRNIKLHNPEKNIIDVIESIASNGRYHQPPLRKYRES